MSDIAAAVSAAEASVAPAPEGAAANGGAESLHNFEGGVAQLIGRLKAKYGDEPGEAIERERSGQPAPDPKDTPAAEPAKEEPVAEAPPAEEPPPAAAEPPAKQPQRLELKNAQLMSANQQLTSDLVTVKGERDEAKAWRQQIETLAKKNPLKVMEQLYGEPLDKIIERGKKGEFDKPELELPPEVAEAVEFAKQQKARLAEEAARAKRQKDFATDLPKVKQFVEQFAKEFPLASVVDDAPEAILESYYQALDEAKKTPGAKPPTLRDIAKTMEDGVAASVGGMFRNSKLVKHYAADADVRKIFVEALGLTEQQKTASPASSTQGEKPTPKISPPAQPPPSVATATEVPERLSRELTDEELEQERLRLFRQGREQGLFQP